MTRHSRLRPLLPAAIFALVAACTSEAPFAPEEIEETFGIYSLASVGGMALPALAFEDEEERWEVVSGSLVLRPDGSFSEAIAFLITYPASDRGPRTVPQVDAGTFTISEGRVTFISTQLSSWIGTLRNRAVKYSVGGGVELSFEL